MDRSPLSRAAIARLRWSANIVGLDAVLGQQPDGRAAEQD